MKKRERMTAGQIVALILLGLVPAAVICFGIFLLLGDVIFNLSFGLTYVLFPGAALVGNYLLVRRVQKRWLKWILCGAVLCGSVFLTVELSLWGSFEMISCYRGEKAAERYSESLPMPELTELGSPADLEYHDYFSQMGIFFTCDSDVLIASYPEGEYQRQKALLEERFVFQGSPIASNGKKVPASVELEGYVFRFLDTEGAYERLYFPKRLMLIGTNDAQKEIVYLLFYDDDLDYISSVESFLCNDCGWEHIR